MSETFTDYRNGWTITVWLSNKSVDVWNYRCTKGFLYRGGFVNADHRNQAVNNACMREDIS